MKIFAHACRLAASLMMALAFQIQFSFSQEAIVVTTGQAKMSKGTQPCYMVNIPQAELKTVQQNLIKKLQESTKAKVKEVDQELVMTGVVKPEVTPDSINLYSILIFSDSILTLNLFVEIDSLFFSPKEDKSDLASSKIDNNIKNYMRGFAVEQYKLAVEDELDAEEEKLKDLEEDLENLEKEEENMVKDISSLENDIEEEEREIESLDMMIDQKQQEILSHSAAMLTVSGEAEKKAGKEKEKELEKEKKQLEKDRSKAKDNISSFKSDIEKNNKAIEEGKELQETRKQEIVSQSEVVEKVKAKLGGIK